MNFSSHSCKASQFRPRYGASVASNDPSTEARLKPYGVASLAPVDSNKIEDGKAGKAKNRRVEPVER